MVNRPAFRGKWGGLGLPFFLLVALPAGSAPEPRPHFAEVAQASGILFRHENGASKEKLTPDPNVTYSACLAHGIEQMFRTGVAPYPIDRTLLVSGILESCLTSKVQNHQRLETPHLKVAYRAPSESVYCRI